MEVKRSGSFDPKYFLAHDSQYHKITKFAKDQAVFSQGEPADAIYYIQSGRAKQFVVSAKGKEAVISIINAGEFFGEGCLAEQPLRISSVVTLEESNIVRLSKAAFSIVLHREPTFIDYFITHLLLRTGRIESDLVDHLLNSSERRLARLLLLLVDFSNEKKSNPMVVQISQETLAEMIGTTRSRVSFFMNKFRRMGFIDYNGAIKVNDTLLNILLHDPS